MDFTEDSPNKRLSTAKPGIIAALPLEVACFAKVDLAPHSHRIMANAFLYYAGVGSQNATRAAQSLIDAGADALVSWGIAGALDPHLAPGDIVLPTDVIDHVDKQRYPVNQRWRAALKNRLDQNRLDPNKLDHEKIYSQGSVVSTRAVQPGPRQKAKLHKDTGAMAVDMESAAIAAVANEENKPFIIIRSISDTTAMQLPSSAINATDPYGRVSILGLLAGLTKNPAELRHYPNLIRSLARAKRSLRGIRERCGLDLCLGEAL
uniref:Adenosylhomocysteine nucleosidase n=1 Tax=Candidatus Kentrum sp. UNK TaxID=2126344 RepID=A0A451B5U7_9GAMM|nr:MAG: adenosylhomocysteine nucleosidase [Candidatus Kentron sp. UNK]VFK73646.1 MAG: adenosylhomocysteine nucleosidase [Candidatus Kentron sp. UNK]